MSKTAPAADADVGPFGRELIAQIRAEDTYGFWEGKPDRDLLAPFIVDRQRARAIPLVGDPDPQTLMRISQFYNAVALSIERRSGVMASPVQQLSSEGFGRIVVIGGRLVVVSKTMRDAHRFGFASVERLEADGEALVEAALAAIERYPDAARAD
jgi:probable nitrogen fixation protein